MDRNDEKIRDALRDIIRGKSVKRIKHELKLDGRDLTQTFINELERLGYYPTTVSAVNVEPGERVPAFYIDQEVAYFGWIFWEQFTSSRMRKLWGSEVKNRLGDWDIQIPATRSTIIYANESLKLEMDIDHPADM
jgi:hypothetical protein